GRSLLVSTVEKATQPAVKPPTSALTFSLCLSGGNTSWRSWLTRSVVACAWGAECGYAWITATLPDGDRRGAVTVATSAVCATAASIGGSDTAGLVPCSSTAVSNRPLKPGPNPSESMWNARYVLVLDGSLPASLVSSRIA